MAARKGTILSDEHILKECAHYRPIPMKLAARIIDGNSVVAKESPFSNKKLKYQRQMSRPEHFDAYAHSISRNLGNDPEFRSKLHTAYTADVVAHMNPPPAEGPDLNAPPPPPQEGPALPALDAEIQRLIEEMQGPAVQPVPEQYNNPIQQDLPENVNVNLDAIPEEEQGASDGDSVPELESDRERERDRSDTESDFFESANPPSEFVEGDDSADETPVPPPPRRSSRPGASRPEGFYSEANQAARGSGKAPATQTPASEAGPSSQTPASEAGPSSQTPASEAGPSSASSSTDPPPPRRSSRAGANKPAGFYSEANQAARGSGAGTTAPNDPSHSNFFFQR